MLAPRHNRSSIQLGILDNWTQVAETIASAELADALGFARYWLTEHPPRPNPQMLAALLAGLTERIRVGTAGILLNYHVPLQAAQQFLLLEHVYPGRIDAGFCGGCAKDLVNDALLDGRCDPRSDPGAYEDRAAQLIGLLRGDLPPGHRYAALSAWPASTGTPEIWSFGTGLRSAELAARHGTAFGFSLLHADVPNETTVVDCYRETFQPNAFRSEPLVSLAVAGVCAPTAREARQIRSGYRNTFLVPTVVGTPRQCHQRIGELAERYGTREIVFMEVSPFEQRPRALRLLAEAFELPGADTDCRGIPSGPLVEPAGSDQATARVG